MAVPQQFPRLGVSACVFRGAEVLLIQRAKPPLAGVWSLPGGHVEPGEAVLDAAARELREETGVEASLSHLVGLYDMIRHDAEGRLTVHYAIACYAGPWTAGEATAGGDALSVRWADPAQLGGMAFTPHVREAIARAKLLLTL
ncbi:MAG: NUDIX hydrolase [Rhizobiales bacterium]|nr:NUDIX hydrolase [Hyphomicrobiales bacterium]MBI3674658.1 NUDIX hydrolase [Hyphomicrobiales bacterium]